MAHRYLGGERPDPSPAEAADATWSWPSRVWRSRRPWRAVCSTRRSAPSGAVAGEARRFVDAEKPWELNKAARSGDAEAAERLRLVLGDLVEICRLLALAAAPFLPATAARIFGQLGYAWRYADDGNGGPPLRDELGWGAHAGETGRLGAAEPLFPRLETETPSD